MSHTRDNQWTMFHPISKDPSTSNFVKNTPLRVVFSTLFSVHGNRMKHCLECLMYYENVTKPWTCIPHKFHHSVHVNDLVMISFEYLCSWCTIVAEPRSKLLIICHRTAHVEYIRKIPGGVKGLAINDDPKDTAIVILSNPGYKRLAHTERWAYKLGACCNRGQN